MLQKKKKLNIVSVDGSVGSGKSTMCTILKQHYKQATEQKRIFFVDEPLNMWQKFGDINVFDAFLKEPDKSWKDILQLVIVSSQLAILKKTLEYAVGHEEYWIVYDRHFLVGLYQFYHQQYLYSDILYIVDKMMRQLLEEYGITEICYKFVYMLLHNEEDYNRITENILTRNREGEVDYYTRKQLGILNDSLGKFVEGYEGLKKPIRYYDNVESEYAYKKYIVGIIKFIDEKK